MGPSRPPPGGVWVLADLRSEATKKATAVLARKARDLATRRNAPLSVVALGSGLDAHLPDLTACGPDRLYAVDHRRLVPYRQETYTGVLHHLVLGHRPEIFLFLANDCGRELAPRLAARLGTGLCSDCIGLDIDPETGLLLQTVAAFGDNIHGRIVTPAKRPQMATVRSTALTVDAGPARAAPVPTEVVRVRLPKDVAPDRVTWLSAEREDTSGTALENAKVVICGGRGMGTAGRFRSLWDLAALMGAEVGATRPAVHTRWIEEDRMVGQTGCNVAPDLLLLFGISGATQFAASIEQARHIVAVNRDPKAPILSRADLGVVGDVKQILPELISKVRRVLIEQYGRPPEEVCPGAARALRGSLGARLKELREERGYAPADVAEALDIPPRGVEDLEANEATPSVSLLLRIARLYRVDPAPFLTMADGARADRKRLESFSKRTQSYSYRTLTPGAEQKHLRAFMIGIDPRKDHKMVEYRHEGEEFVYVLRGQVRIKVGEELHTLRRAESLHFDATIPHHLRNPAAQKAELLVVLYTP